MIKSVLRCVFARRLGDETFRHRRRGPDFPCNLTEFGTTRFGSRGYDRGLADVAKQDQKAIARATQYRGAVLDCRARGLRWDQTSGQRSGR